MNKISRLLLALASILLICVYFYPLWKVVLTAPQYPEGLGMLIWVNTITGEKPNDLYNINILNHYIGMQKIEPEKVVELKIMPFVFAFFILLGLYGAFTGRRGVLKLWVTLFVIFGVIAIADFWWWEYRYGHNLDPNAPIKVPGLAYQPPLIGCKTLLNFHACSWPHIGAFIAFASLVLGFIAVFVDMYFKEAPKGVLK